MRKPVFMVSDKEVSNQPAKLQKLARKLKFDCSKSRYGTLQSANNKDVDQTALMFANPARQVFSRLGSNNFTTTSSHI